MAQPVMVGLEKKCSFHESESELHKFQEAVLDNQCAE